MDSHTIRSEGGHQICVTYDDGKARYTAWGVPGSGTDVIKGIDQGTATFLHEMFGISYKRQGRAVSQARRIIGVFDDAQQARKACGEGVSDA